MSRSGWTTATVALPVFLATLGCSQELAGPLSELRSARATWERSDLHSYEYVYHVTCFCAIVEPVRVVVADDSVTAAYFVDGGEALPPEQVPWMPDVDELFDRLEDVLSQDPVQYEAEFDPSLGYPTRATVDVSRQIADEEFSFSAYDLAATTR